MDPFPVTILLATDGSQEAELAKRMAVGIAKSTGSALHIVHIASSAGIDPRVYQESRRRARELLDEQVIKIHNAGVAITGVHLRTGRPDEEILALSKEIGAGLIAVGSRGLGGVKRTLMGSISDSVVRRAHCPVLIARE